MMSHTPFKHFSVGATGPVCVAGVPQVVWSFTRLVMSDIASDEMRKITARMLCCVSTIPMARAALVEQRGVPAMASIVAVSSTMAKPEFLHRCVAMAIRNLSFNSPDPLKVKRRGSERCTRIAGVGCCAVL